MVPLSLEAIGGPRTLHSTLSSVIKHQFPSSPKSLKLHLELWYHSQFYHESLEIMGTPDWQGIFRPFVLSEVDLETKRQYSNGNDQQQNPIRLMLFILSITLIFAFIMRHIAEPVHCIAKSILCTDWSYLKELIFINIQ